MGVSDKTQKLREVDADRSMQHILQDLSTFPRFLTSVWYFPTSQSEVYKRFLVNKTGQMTLLCYTPVCLFSRGFIISNMFI